jgi:antirestriction protein
MFTINNPCGVLRDWNLCQLYLGAKTWSTTMIAPHSIQKSASSISSSSNRRSAATTRSVVGSHRPDILLHFSSHHTFSVGFASSPRPRHIAALPAIDICSLRSARAAEDVFRLYAAPIQRVVHLLGGSGGLASSNQNQQRYIVLHNQGIYVNRYWKLAIMRILQDTCNAAMISFQCAVHMAPFAILPPPRFESFVPSVVLTVYISGLEAHCMIYANCLTLEYTYQSCSCESVILTSPESDEMMIGRLRQNQETLWLRSENSCSLVRAIALCLEKCPLQIRKEAIHNMYFVGTILADNFKEKVAVLLYNYLTGDGFEEVSTVADVDKASNEEEVSSPRSVLSEFTQLPIRRTLLRPLADHIALIDCEIPSELIPWVGACIWINYWRLHELESGNTAEKMQWIDTSTVAAPWKL